MTLRHYNRPDMTSLSKRLACLSLSGLMIISLPACQRASEQAGTKADQAAIVIKGDTVTMDASHIVSIKSKRYQPSLGLKGVTSPIAMATLKSPTDAVIQSINTVKTAQVEDQAALLTLAVIAPSTDPSPQALDQDSTTADSAALAQDTDQQSPAQINTRAHAADKEANDLTSTAPADATTEPKTQPVSQNQTALNARSESQSSADNPKRVGHDRVLAEQDRDGQTMSPYQVGDLLTVNAPFAGQIDQLFVQVGQTVTRNQPLIKLSNPNDLQFIATLPIADKSQLSIGQNVNFSVEGSDQTFTGQVSKLIPSTNPNHLLVYVHILPNNENTFLIGPNMAVSGRIDYGQMEVGTIVPKQGVHDADLSELAMPPYQPIKPIKANVWIIGQDQRLTQQAVSVIEYDPKTEQYLVAGISNDSLICLAPLPASAAGKKVVVS